MKKQRITLFSNVPDPRVIGRCVHKLSDILFIAVSTLICNGEDFEDMALFAKERFKWLKKVLGLSEIPSHDTFNRVLQLIDSKELLKCLVEDSHRLLDILNEKQISIDGKKIKGVSPKSKGNKGLHILSAYVSENNICVGQVKVDDKSNEITAIPELLDTIDISGATVSIDAIGCQKEIATKITDNGGEYLLALKKNQKLTFEHVEDTFKLGSKLKLSSNEEREHDHGRIETRKCTIIQPEKLAEDEIFSQWKELKTLVKIESSREIKGVVSNETRYYLSSCSIDNPKYYNTLARGHWAIENNLHWHLDVTFKEDASRARSGNAPENLNILRKFALQRIDQLLGKLSKKKKRYKASLTIEYLKNLLRI